MTNETRKQYGFSGRYDVETGEGHYESFRWCKSGQFFLLADAARYAKSLNRNYVRICTHDGSVIWNRRDNNTAALDILLASEDESHAEMVAARHGNTLRDTAGV